MCVASIPKLVSCINNINRLMSSNRLKLNLDKTDFILLGTYQQLAKINCKSIKISGCYIPISNQATCLIVLVDDEMTFAARIRRLTSRCFYQLRQLWSVRRALTVEAIRMLVHAFIISHVDYCNSVFGSTSAVHLRPLQSVLNTAARLIIRKQKFDRTTDSIQDELHWLPLLQRYHYKLSTHL